MSRLRLSFLRPWQLLKNPSPLMNQLKSVTKVSSLPDRHCQADLRPNQESLPSQVLLPGRKHLNLSLHGKSQRLLPSLLSPHVHLWLLAASLRLRPDLQLPSRCAQSRHDLKANLGLLYALLLHPVQHLDQHLDQGLLHEVLLLNLPMKARLKSLLTSHAGHADIASIDLLYCEV